ncbi:MAG: hypothetical protein O3B01_03055 [Planctomycetota bacterium]|nr:hypothetical protein [Planctomycetota bacterium]
MPSVTRAPFQCCDSGETIQANEQESGEPQSSISEIEARGVGLKAIEKESEIA